MISNQVSLYSLAEWKNGFAFKRSHFSIQGKPIIKIAELKNGITAQTDRTQMDFDKSVHLSKGDMVFSWSGNPETSLDVFWYDLEDGWLNQHIFKITPNENVDRLYLFYLLKYLKPRFVTIATNKQTTGLGHITVQDMKRIMVDLPDLNVQKAIGEYLYSIDQKSYVNRKINDNLYAQAKAIFDDRFIDLVAVPTGWRKGNLLDVASYLNGLAMQKFRPLDNEAGLPVLKIKELRQGSCDTSSELCSSSIKPEYIVHDGDVIFSWSGSLLVDIWCGGTCGLNQHLFKVTSNTYEKWFYYLWTAHHLDRFIAIAADKATTMGHIKREELSKAEVLIPSAEDYKEISSIIKPIFELMISNRIEARKLAALRDALLPKLMSGEINVSEASL